MLSQSGMLSTLRCCAAATIGLPSGNGAKGSRWLSAFPQTYLASVFGRRGTTPLHPRPDYDIAISRNRTMFPLSDPRSYMCWYSQNHGRSIAVMGQPHQLSISSQDSLSREAESSS
ncbi:hypothetical protein F4678DRAFT_477319 [Xylaria arbuscula]|nr:hypothetical protein F4678DRAFT_477319 [Xylaria arbuscula]